jgi:hypothetical protein
MNETFEVDTKHVGVTEHVATFEDTSHEFVDATNPIDEIVIIDVF